MNDANPGLSKLLLAYTVLGAGLNFVSSVRTRGVRRSVFLFVLGTGLPAAGELLATGPLKLLRHRVRYRIAGVPFGILLGWYAVVHGSLVVAGRVAERLELRQGSKIRTLPPLAALVGLALDLILDPAGLDAGLWEWNADGAYAAKIVGANGNSGVPLVNYLGWAALVGGVVYVYGLAYEYEVEEDLLPAVLLLPLYLAAVGWALRRRKFGHLLYSVPFPVALYAALEKR
ncbi:Carotenoid biosynthesis protein [uncultured Rubrobacteraceae bacterium]|uniref:Carotenoid biosynthesis protein n=1 Tax=uncultured Rubrobacteraceae bacterium TaxID=349277 RepID=A0A6J4PC82_9ACTN|nr:Carotenoid biosynthesis protein [uncultured Rubrobacteraceae bacterium]